jgi:hypothetical protein
MLNWLMAVQEPLANVFLHFTQIQTLQIVSLATLPAFLATVPLLLAVYPAFRMPP